LRQVFASKFDPWLDTDLSDIRAGEQGVVDVAILGVIQRWRLGDGLPIREVARRTGEPFPVVRTMR
jgi:hypothetical protein